MNILITGIGGPTPKGIARSIKLAFNNIRLIGVDANPFASGFYVGEPYDETYLVPNASRNPDEYWKEIEEIILSEEIEYAFIVPETEVLQWSLRQKNGNLPCPALLPELDIAEFLFDKKSVSELLYPFGLSPKTIEVKRDQLKLVGEELGYPYWIRVNKTAGAIGALKIECIGDVENWLNISKDLTAEYISSSYLPGRNYACKLLYKSGELILGAVGERIEYLMANASPSKISGMCSRGKVINREDIFYSAENALNIIHNKFDFELNGMFTVDFKEDCNGKPLITEINIRHVSFTHAFSVAGANFPAKTLKAFVQNSDDYHGLFNFEKEMNFIRGVDNEILVVGDDMIKRIQKIKASTKLNSMIVGGIPYKDTFQNLEGRTIIR